MASSGLLSSFVGILRSNWRPQVEAKRFRYWKDLREKGYQRRFGWEDKLPRGLLPRIEGKKLNSMPIYHAKNGFSEERATKGQNDYIDILGDSTLHPARIVSGVPTWLKTFRGNEFRRLVRKEKMFDRGTYPLYRPTKWSKMKTRMDWLWYELNYRRRIR
ncbi:hypothetical protein V9T40_010144 [Parthenolecanium corni]|uniref:Large ribosomal subunit protein mL51 n=1 Tax=Parthenolecanium corni TaxID=536013 RepID=A0AAN9XX15_9HEMI